ncbi:phage tail tape measure protein [Halostagnicola sp. A56]|uniref:phage tail tape measure protein n=1 Tax=Halostagnicola sp. A56 TaxID=1495067 RepID=UPI0018CD4A42|nr:phage tail tape measure protein [Halostagnicola sp. A56]
MGVTAPLAAMGALSARTAANFDQAMQRSISVMGDVDESMRDKLEQRAREVANTTTHSADQAAQSYYYLASAGLDAAQSMEAMPEVAAFAEAGNMQMAEATDVATNVMSAFGYEADEMSKVTDTLTGTVSNHNQTMEGMSTAMSNVAPIASSLGISIEETSAAIGQMGDVGIQGQRAGTALRNVLSQVSDETSPVTKRLEEMGVATRDSEGNILSLTQILKNMENAGVEASDAASIFGTEAGPAMAALISEGSSALEENTQKLEDADGATREMATTQRDTLNAQLQIAKSNLLDVGIAIGSILIPMLTTLTGYATVAAERFQGLNKGQQRAIVVVAALVAALGPLLILVGTLLTMLPAMATGASMAAGAFGTLWSALLGPIGLVIAAVIGLAAAWKTNFMNIQGHTEDGVNAVLDLLNWMVDQVNKILPNRWEIDFEAEDVDFTTEGDSGEEQTKSDYLPNGMSADELQNAGSEDFTSGQNGQAPLQNAEGADVEKIESIYAQLEENQGSDGATETDTAPLQEQLDASSESTNSDIESMLEDFESRSSRSSGQTGQQDLSRVIDRLDQLLEAIRALGGPQEISGTLDLDGLEAEIRGIVESENERIASRADVRGARGGRR